VVQRQVRHYMVELPGIGELLDPRTPEDETFGCPRVDRSHGVTNTREGSSQLPLPTTDL